MVRSFAAAVVAVASVAAAALVWTSLRDKPESLTIARIKLPMEALLYVADAKGYCREEGVEVRYTDFQTGRQCLDSTLSGQNDLATVYTTPFVMDSCAGQDIAILAALHTSSRSTALVARPGSGIFEPGDLAGKTVGVPPRTSAVVFLRLLLTANGVDPDSVSTVDMPVGGSEAFLAEGTADAVVTWHPYLANLLATFAGDKPAVLFCDVYLEMSLLAGRREVLQRKQEAIRRLLRALGRAEDFIRARPLEARRLVADAIGEPAFAPNSPLWNEFSPSLSLSHVVLQTLDDDANWLSGTGGCDRPPEFRSLVYDGPLREVLPERVTLPRDHTGPAGLSDTQESRLGGSAGL